jgi:hypothetical protein
MRSVTGFPTPSQLNLPAGRVAGDRVVWRGERRQPDRLMIDATLSKAHRTAASLLRKGTFPEDPARMPVI